MQTTIAVYATIVISLSGKGIELYTTLLSKLLID